MHKVVKLLASLPLLAAACVAAHAEDGTAPYYVQKHPSMMAGSPTPAPAPKSGYNGPHQYRVKRNGMFGYTDSNGQIHFFGNATHINGVYQVVNFDGPGGLIRCKDDCSVVDVYGAGGQQTFEPQRGSILWAVVQDMLAGAL